MIRHRFYIGMMAVVLLLPSCSQEEDAALPKGTVSKVSLTRATTDGTTPIDAGYGSLTVYAYEGTEEDNHTVWNYENGTWQQSGTLLVPVRDANFIGVTGTGTPFSFTLSEVAKDQSTDDGKLAADFMTTDRTALDADNALSLNFKHRMAQVTVNIKEYGTEFGDTDPTISDVMFQSAASVALDYDAAETVTVTSATTFTIDITPSGTLTDGYSAIIAPKAAGEQLMSLQANGKTLTVKTNADIESGKSYTFSLQVGKDYVTLQGISIGDWQTTTPQAGNTANIALPEVTDEKAGIFIHYADNDADNVDNLKLDASTSQTIDHVWKSNDATPHIVIYSPYDGNVTYDGNLALEYGKECYYASINANGSQTVSELLGGDNTLNIGDAYQHVMGKLTLKFQDGSGTDITPSDVNLNNFYENATLSLASGTIDFTGNFRTKEKSVSDGYSGLLVIPQIIPQYGDMVTATYNGKKYIYTPNEDFVITGGEHVTLTLTIPDTSTRSAGDTPRRMKGIITIEKEDK